ncbi:MAG: bile acid:sodium symporter family protein, partial [Ferruginibacter sp.]
LLGSIGISLIFFFYGLKLSTQKMQNGLKNWRLHLLVQASTFILFPIIVLAFLPFVKEGANNMYWLSFLFLAAVPSTVSSSVVMVSMARGNVTAAIFNASISGLLGIVITPLLVGLFLTKTNTEFDLNTVYLKLLTEIIVPVLIGLTLQKYFGAFAVKNNRYLSFFDKSVILLIVFKSFAASFYNQVFAAIKVSQLLMVAAATLLLFFSVYFFIGWISKKLLLNREDQITAQFCGTKKSLIHGTIFSKILFSASFPMGIILLPLMLFHAFQLLLISIFAARLLEEQTKGKKYKIAS